MAKTKTKPSPPQIQRADASSRSTQHDGIASTQTLAASRQVLPSTIEAMLSDLSINERQREADALEEFAAICLAFRETALKDKANPYFVALIKFATARKLVTESQLGELGDTTRESANRWVNEKATTSLSNQRQVLGLLAELATRRAEMLRKGKPDDTVAV